MATAAALLAFILVFERNGGPADRTGAALKVFPSLTPAQVTKIEIVTAQQTVRVERTNLVWKLTSPVVYPARSRQIEAFLEACAQAEARTSIDARDLRSQPRGLADYGLSPPVATVIFHLGNERRELRLGLPSPVGDSLYAQRAGDEGVLVVDASFVGQFPKYAHDWREPALVSLEGLSFNRVEVRSGGRGFEVTRDPLTQLWQITRPPPLKRADNAKLNLLVREMANWQIAQFVSDDPAADLQPFGLNPPQAELIVGQGTNDLVTVQFGASPTNAPQLVFARRLSHTNIVLAPRNWLDALTQPHEAFRDRRLLAFLPDSVHQVAVQGASPFTLQRTTNGAWRALNDTNFVADPELVAAFLDSIYDLEIADFEKDVVTDADLAAFGLAPPVTQITLLGQLPANALAATNPVLGQILLGTGTSPNRVAVRRADESSVYGVPTSLIRRLPQSLVELRDRGLWNFTLEHVVSLTAARPGAPLRRLNRTPDGTWQFAADSYGSFEPLIVEEMVTRLGLARAERWVARGTDQPARFGVPEAGLRLELELRSAAGTRRLTLEFGARTAGGNRYAVTEIDGQPMVFEFPGKLFDELLQFVFPPAPQP
jgi:hypothetical protein